MKLLSLFADLGTIHGGKGKKNTVTPSQDKTQIESESYKQKPKLGTKPETVEAIKTIVVSGLEILLFPFL